jgi:glycosyltransferase 2 family protein
MIGRDRLWRAASLVVTVAALGFVALKIADSAAGGLSLWNRPELWLRFMAAAVIYALSLSFVAAGWMALVGSASSLPTSVGFRIYGVSQLYKYLPSNVLHYVGRHAALKRIGVGHQAALFGAAGEIGLLIPAALLIAATARIATLPQMGTRMLDLAVGVSLAFLAGAAALCALLPWLRRQPRLATLVEGFASPAARAGAVRALGCYLFFFTASGLAFAILAAAGPDGQAVDLPLLVAIWAGAWVLGFVTPGAPAGLGVREALLVAALAAAGAGEGAAAIAVAMRLATIAGDLLFAAGAWAFGARAGTVRPL